MTRRAEAEVHVPRMRGVGVSAVAAVWPLGSCHASCDSVRRHPLHCTVRPVIDSLHDNGCAFIFYASHPTARHRYTPVMENAWMATTPPFVALLEAVCT